MKFMTARRAGYRVRAAAVMAAIVFGGTSAAAAAERPGESPLPIRVLIVDGFSNHDWRLTTDMVRDVLASAGNFTIAVSTAPPSAQADGWDTWRPAFHDYDVIIQNTNDINGGPQWPRAVQADFEQYVAGGGGVYILHSANNAFPDWPAYDEIIGLGWRRKETGWAIAIGSDEQLLRIPPGEGQDTGHGSRPDAVVSRLGDHVIHAGLPRRWLTPNLEVYYYARGPAHAVEILSYAYDKVTRMQWPIEWTVQYGKGRVYNSTFGHVWSGEVESPSLRCAGVQTLMVRALEWLAGRPVDARVPADFPDDTTISVRPVLR